MRPVVTDIAFTLAPRHAHTRGFLGWARFTLDGRLGLDGVAVRRGANGRLLLSFPERVDGAGRTHPIVRPLDDATRCSIEIQVFDALAKDGRLSA
ncbi:MAG: hypothetical protein IT459_21290 [Planctomycetes bacterium]|nr:hypothetical protein [Planctomycetota bacterium]